MPHPDLAVVTGAFSYTGRYVTRRLLDQGVRVRTLTRNPDAEDPFGGRVEVAPLDFSDPDGMRRSMQGAGVFYNTYWIRYAHGRITFDLAVENTGTLFEAAERAGVGRVVHFSVTNVSSGSGAALLQRQGPGGGYAEGPWSPLRHHQTDAGLRGRRPAAQQHGLGSAALSCLPRLRGAETTGSNPSMWKTLQPRRWRPAHRARTQLPMQPGRTRSPSRTCFACWPQRLTRARSWCPRHHRWPSPLPDWSGC